MPSFDIVNSLNIQEIDNAVNMVKRDINNRYDFKGSSSSITLNKSDKSIIIEGDNDYQMTAIVDMLQNRAIGRKVSIKTFKLFFSSSDIFENFKLASYFLFISSSVNGCFLPPLKHAWCSVNVPSSVSQIKVPV